MIDGLGWHRGRIKVVLIGVDTQRVQAVKDALTEIWDFIEWEELNGELSGVGEDWVTQDLDTTLLDLVKAAARTSQAAIHIEVYVQAEVTKVRRWNA